MQPRTLDQILTELQPIYQPQIANLEAQRALIPQQTEANIKSAESAQTKAYEDILTGARRRGLGFSGIPLGEQAQYASNVFAPSILSARATGQSQALSLQDAINQIYERQRTQAEGIRQFDTSMAENMRQANLSAASARSQFSPTYNPPNPVNPTATDNPYLPRKNYSKESGYQFIDAYGVPLTAADYSMLMRNQFSSGQTYRQLLQEMAGKGDANATIALNYVGDDYKFGGAPEQYRTALEALGATGKYMTPQQTKNAAYYKPRSASNVSIPIPNFGYKAR